VLSYAWLHKAAGDERAQEDAQYSQIKTATNFLPHDLFT